MGAKRELIERDVNSLPSVSHEHTTKPLGKCGISGYPFMRLQACVTWKLAAPNLHPARIGIVPPISLQRK